MSFNQPVVFKKVRAEWGWLSNMSPHPITGGWRTAEALFQALRFQDERIRQLIKDEKSPMGAKMKAKSFAKFMNVVPRSGQDLDNMKYVVYLKLGAHPDLSALLLSTGDREIIEDVTARPNESGLFWGAALMGNDWVGQNHLGKIWMNVREGLGK